MTTAADTRLCEALCLNFLCANCHVEPLAEVLVGYLRGEIQRLGRIDHEEISSILSISQSGSDSARLVQTSFASSPHRRDSLMRLTRWFTNINRNSVNRPRFFRGIASRSGNTKQLSPASITCKRQPLAKNLPSTCMPLRTCIMECIVFMHSYCIRTTTLPLARPWDKYSRACFAWSNGNTLSTTGWI